MAAWASGCREALTNAQAFRDLFDLHGGVATGTIPRREIARQIQLDFTSSCRELSVGNDP
jgi:hypothetical protein